MKWAKQLAFGAAAAFLGVLVALTLGSGPNSGPYPGNILTGVTGNGVVYMAPHTLGPGTGGTLTNVSIISTTNILVYTNNVDYITTYSNTFVTFLTDVYFSGKSYLNLTVATNLPGTGFGYKTLITPTSQGTNFVIDGSVATYFKYLCTNDFHLLYVTNKSTLGAGGVSCSIKLFPNGSDRNVSINSNICLLDTNGWTLLTTMNPGIWWRSLTNAAINNGARVGWLSVSIDDPTYVQTNVTALFKESP